jgi:hypothetical protein
VADVDEMLRKAQRRGECDRQRESLEPAVCG